LAKVLKSDISARVNLLAEQKNVKSTKAELSEATSRFKVLVGTLLFISLGVAVAYGALPYTFWALEGATLVALVWWATLVAPQVIKLHRARTQLRAVEHGLQGEEAVARTLAEGLPADYFVINDITITLASQETQIDHVVVAPTRVLCIETKNWRGLYSSGRQGWLWQPLHRPAGKPRWHKDPQTQSTMHRKALAEYLATESLECEVEAVVVLVDPKKVQWQGERASTDCSVIYLHQLIAFIQDSAGPSINPALQERMAYAILGSHIR